MEGSHSRSRRLVAAAVTTLAVLGWTVVSPSIAEASEPDVMVLSSWAPAFDAGAIAGGSQTVTMTNLGAVTIPVSTFDTHTRPCGCAITGLTLSRGTLHRGFWVVTNLDAGETATMNVHYHHRRTDGQNSPVDIPSTAGQSLRGARSTTQRTLQAL